jgi:RNA polymerase-binding transcription factor
MNTNSVKTRLEEKERDLLGFITRLEQNARESGTAEVEDPIDRVISSEGKAGSFRQATLEHRTLAEVQAAMRRLEDGTYGKCLDCGRPIESTRLEAVPWAAYCLADQEKHDRAESESESSPDLQSAE